jgi:hypothetical protein
VPEAVTENVADSPTVTVWLLGCMVTTGATAPSELPEETDLDVGGVWAEDKPMHPLSVTSDAIRKANIINDLGAQLVAP